MNKKYFRTMFAFDVAKLRLRCAEPLAMRPLRQNVALACRKICDFEETMNPPNGTALLESVLLNEIDSAPQTDSPLCLSVNFAVSLDGQTSLDGRSGAIAGPADKTVFHLLRAGCDAVLVGARTAAIENYGPVRLDDALVQRRQSANRSATPSLIVVSNSGNFPEISGSAGELPILVTARVNQATVTAKYPRNRKLFVGDDTVVIDELRSSLAQCGFQRVLCEGGPTLFGSLLQANCVDLINLTIAPRIVGQNSVPLVPGLFSPDPRRWKLVHSAAHDSDLFVRYIKTFA